MKRKSNSVEVIEGGIGGIGSIGWVSSSNLGQCRKMLTAGKLDGLGIGVSLGYDFPSIDVLRDIHGLKGLWFADVKGVDITSLHSFTQLEFLGMDRRDELIDLSEMRRLQAVFLYWSPKIKWPLDSSDLKNLRLQKFKPSSGALAELEALSALEVLQLAQGTVKCLAGIERFPKLKELELHYLPSLESIKDVAKTPVEKITITHCKRLTDLDRVAGCKKLQVLRYHDSAQLPSIAFVNDCPSLKEFRFVGVDVIDGDLTPLKRLDQFAFTQKKHFSHTEKALRMLGK